MPLALVRRNRSRATIAALYGAIVAQARTPAFYAEYGVPDTLDGRFDLIVLHLALLLRRLRSEGEPGRELSQGCFDAFCRDMDDNLRELGVSDLAVPRRMRSFGAAYYGRAAAYDRALAETGDATLAETFGRNIYPQGGGEPGLLASYVRAAERELLRQDLATFARGQVRFPDAAEAAAGPPQT